MRASPILFNLTFGLLLLMDCTHIASGEVLMSKEDALKRIMPQAEVFESKTLSLTREEMEAIAKKANAEIEEHPEYIFQIYIGKVKGFIIGYAIEDTVHGKWGPIHYMAGMTKEGSVRDIVVLEYRERRGKPVAKRRFLKQFQGKTIQDPMKLRDDIDGITGATISSRGLTDGVRKLLHLFEEYLKS